MAFAPLSIDTEAPRPPLAPAYVYGRSGRCWKFNNPDPDEILNYFKCLYYKGGRVLSLYPLSAKLHDWLEGKYGATILERLKSMNDVIIEPCDFEVVITNSDGSTTCSEPRRYKHFSRNANLTIYSHNSWRNYMLDISTDFWEETKRNDVRYNNIQVCMDVYELDPLFLDYWKGDRVIYSAPREQPAPTATPTTEELTPAPQAPVVEASECLPFLRYRGRRVSPAVSEGKKTVEYTPLMIEIN
jgi:hypothetical protein